MDRMGAVRGDCQTCGGSMSKKGGQVSKLTEPGYTTIKDALTIRSGDHGGKPIDWIPKHMAIEREDFLQNRVEELERELAEKDKRIESMYLQWNRADAKLQRYRELAEMIEHYYGCLEKHSIASKRTLAKARELLKEDS